jgi:curved DNA-binding protein CbpA
VVPAGRDGDHGHPPACLHHYPTHIVIMTTEPIDCYAILGVPRDATQAQISVAYRTLLRRYHPDTRIPTDSSRDDIADAALQHVLTAYAVLHDPARRNDYDQQTTPRVSPARTPARPIHLSRRYTFDDPPLRAGPVYWTP